MVDIEPTPGRLSVGQEYTIDFRSVHCRAPCIVICTLIQILETACFWEGRKLENLADTHTKRL